MFSSVPDRARSFIGNRFEEASGGRVSAIFDPSTGERISVADIAEPADVDRAVSVASEAQRSWARLTLDDRVEYLDALRALIAEHAEEIARLESLNSGMPLDSARGDIGDALRALRRWPGLATAFRGESMRTATGFHFTQHLPYGVVARLVAFNHPFLFAVKGTLAALLAGNAIVLKPADPTPLTAVLLGELVAECLPSGVFNIVLGDRTTGEALVKHPEIKRIAFTGSTATGRAIQMAAAGQAIKHVSLELGGKNPMIVLPDVDAATMGEEIVRAMSLRGCQGQSCGSMSRVLVHRDVYADVVDSLAAAVDGLTLGAAYAEGVDMGPLVTEAHRDRVLGYVRTGLGEGARLVAGGEVDSRVPTEGYFVAPTVFSDVDPGNTIAREEIFGPVISVMPWADEAEVVRMANDTEYGLTASVWTSDVDAAFRIAGQAEAGYVWINDSAVHHFGMPFGGMKNSGLGREESREEFGSYLQTKSVHLRYRDDISV